MKWFKHISDSHNDPQLALAVDQFGGDAYHVFWVVLEMYAKEYDHIDDFPDGFIPLPWTKLRQNLHKSRAKVEKILKYFSEIAEKTNGKPRIQYRIEGGLIFVKVPKFQTLADDYARRQHRKKYEQNTDNVPPKEVEVEVEVEVEKTKIIYGCERFTINAEQHQTYREAYPDIDHIQQYKKMAAWLIGRPRKWQKRPLQGVNGWLRREQVQHDGLKKTADILSAGSKVLAMPPAVQKPKRVEPPLTLEERCRRKVREEKK